MYSYSMIGYSRVSHTVDKVQRQWARGGKIPASKSNMKLITS